MIDLEFVSTDDLKAELFRRYDHIGIIGCKDVTDDASERFGSWQGNTHTVIGLLAELQHQLIRAIERRSRRR